jgi:HD-like signal output (HDOD) protein
MTASREAMIRERVDRIETTPAIPAVFLPLLNLLQSPPDKVKLEEVVKLVSYDNAVATQCLRVASSPLFGLSKPPESIKGAVISLGLRRVETILLTCCLGHAFPTACWPFEPTVFWTHSLGCAMVARKFSDKLSCFDGDKAYMGGLLHDTGLLVNCMVFPKEFAAAVALARDKQLPLEQAELECMGFTHSESGRALAERWHLNEDAIQVIAHHHSVERSSSARGLVALVHLSDLLCRMRNLGFNYYERQAVDMASDPAWAILASEHKELNKIDVERFTFELDESLDEIHQLVATIFGSATLSHS